MIDIDAIITGLDELERVTERVELRARKVVEIGAEAACAVLENEMRSLVPVRSGVTRDSITTQRQSALSWHVGPTEGNAYRVEFGTAHHGPQPFVGPAAHKMPEFLRAEIQAEA